MLADLGFKIGESPVTEDAVAKVVAAVKEASSVPRSGRADESPAGGGCCS
jgi:hypothetical protein